MSKSICATIRQELDEMMLGQDCGGEVARHLGDCAECRDFHQKQTRLRQIVGSLGTVSAPPDFDFRLRSRLVNENSTSSFHLTSSFLTFGQRSVAAATALALLVAAVVLVRHFANRKSPAPTVAEKVDVSPIAPSENRSDRKELVGKQENQATAPTSALASNSSGGKRIVGGGLRPKRQLAVLEQSSEGAAVVGGTRPSETIFPIDASQQALRVSLFDGRGNPRTISLPPVSFGSQRVVPTSASFAPKGVW